MRINQKLLDYIIWYANCVFLPSSLTVVLEILSRSISCQCLRSSSVCVTYHLDSDRSASSQNHIRSTSTAVDSKRRARQSAIVFPSYRRQKFASICNSRSKIGTKVDVIESPVLRLKEIRWTTSE